MDMVMCYAHLAPGHLTRYADLNAFHYVSHLPGRGIAEKRLPGSNRRFCWSSLCALGPNANRICSDASPLSRLAYPPGSAHRDSFDDAPRAQRRCTPASTRAGSQTALIRAIKCGRRMPNAVAPGSILAPALVLFHLVDDVLGNAQLLARGQYRLDLFARLKPYSVFSREYFRY